jgi:alanyl-tRNA synthetase
MDPNPEIDTALHVLKGSVQKVLGTPVTTGVWAERNKGRLTVECTVRPSEHEIVRIGELANDMVRKDIPVEMFEMDRTDAERTFGRIIYDRFPVPDDVRILTLTRIREWNINCCRGPHLSSTGGLGRIGIRKWRFREARGELEISFEIDNDK